MLRFALTALLTLAACPALAQCADGVCLLPGPGGSAAGTDWHAPRIPAPDAQLAERLRASTVRIINDEGSSKSIGSGTIIEATDRAALVLTCGHLFREGIGSVVVVTREHGAFAGRVVGVDAAWDIAVVQIAPLPSPALPLAASPPSASEMLAYGGYGPHGRFATGLGRLIGFVRMQGTPTADTLQLAGAARQGDSGGPIVDTRGQLVGLIVGTDGRIVIGPSCRPIARFLAPFRSRVNQGTGDRGQEIKNDQTRMANDEPRRFAVSPHGDAFPDSYGALPDANTDTGAAASPEFRSPHSEIRNSPDPELRHPDSALDTSRQSEIASQSSLTSEVLTWLLPLLLGALGISVPPTTVLVAFRLFRCVRRARRRKMRRRLRNHRRQESSPKQQVSTCHEEAESTVTPAGDEDTYTSRHVSLRRHLNDDYAGQLASVFAYSGQSPLQDATLGREFSREIDRAAQSSDAKMAAWAKDIRDRVMRRFHRIHGWTPSPAEPTE